MVHEYIFECLIQGKGSVVGFLENVAGCKQVKLAASTQVGCTEDIPVVEFAQSFPSTRSFSRVPCSSYEWKCSNIISIIIRDTIFFLTHLKNVI